MASQGEQSATLENTTFATPVPFDPFKAHLVALLSIYEIGEPDRGTRIPRYEGPTNLQTDEILRSLDAIVKRMWSAEAVSQLNGAHSQLDNEKVDELGDQNKQSSEADTLTKKPDEGIYDFELPAAHYHCPTCACGELMSDPDVHTAYDFEVPIIPPSIAASEIKMSPTEELRLLKSQVSDIARVCNAVARGDLNQKITVPVHGTVMVQLKDVVNTMVGKLVQIERDVKDACEGFLTGESAFCSHTLPHNVEVAWPELTNTVNKVINKFTHEIRVIAMVTRAVYLGDLSKQIELKVEGEMLALNEIVNHMVLRLRALDKELNRATLEVENQGKLSAPAHVKDMDGVWLNLINNFNRICSLLPNEAQDNSNDSPEVNSILKSNHETL